MKDNSTAAVSCTMRLLAQQQDKRFWYLRLEPPYDTPIPSFGRPFVAIVVACDPNITVEQQAHISTQLVERDCRYMLAWGINASTWDDSVDMAYLNTDPNFSPPDDRHVMTTWHDNESLDTVVWFALANTNFDSHHFCDFMVVMIGANPKTETKLLRAIQNQVRSV